MAGREEHRGDDGSAGAVAAIGVLSTLAHLGLYLLLRELTGPIPANLVALLGTAVANTAANRRLTFGVRGRAGAARHQVQGLLVLSLGLGLTTGALATLGWWAPEAGRPVEVGALVVANAVVTVLRFVAFRHWVFRPPARSHRALSPAGGQGPRDR